MEGSDVARETYPRKVKIEELDAPHAGRPAEPGLRPHPETLPPRLTSDPPAWPGAHGPIGSLSAADLAAGREAPGHAAMPADEWVRGAAAASVAAVLRSDGYDGLTFQSVARRAGLEGDDVRGVFPSRADMALKALRPAFERPAGRSAFTSPGKSVVACFLEFWETGDNALILRSLLSASVRDERLAARLEAQIVGTLIRPFAEDVGATDAYPRARLAFSQLLGLAMSRYLLPQEPLASADIETIAAWAGPSLDYCLRGELGYSVSSLPPATPRAPAPALQLGDSAAFGPPARVLPARHAARSLAPALPAG